MTKRPDSADRDDPIVVVSPHLDDAVLSCGQLLAARPGSTVVTVFAGTPDAAQECPGWDARCGFASAAAAMAARREEDSSALALLHARPLWLDFLDSQYGQTPSTDELCATLQQVLRELAPRPVLIPLGLFHSDHLLVHRACAAALRVPSGMPLLVYEDVPYRSIDDLLQQRFEALREAGAVPMPAFFGVPRGHEALKARAVQAYASQLQGLGSRSQTDAAQPERYWRLDFPGQRRREDGASPLPRGSGTVPGCAG